jgi:hypothetical protein
MEVVMKRRAFLTIAGLGSVAFFVPNRLLADPQSILANGNKVSLECLGDKPGARFLDGRTANGTVGLVPQIKTKTFSGTQWLVHMNSRTQQVFLECRGTVEGPRFLDGRTADGSVGLAPNTKKPFTGTLWQAVDLGNDTYNFKCLGDIEGSRFLDGRTTGGSVGLAPNTNPPFTGTRWRVARYPQCIDDPCD